MKFNLNQYNEKDTRIINEHQQKLYESFEESSTEFFLNKYSDILKKMKIRKDLNILDIGGASGHFAARLYEYFKNNNCKITVIDITKYNTWDKFSERIRFVEVSANNIDTLFCENTFDLIFTNRAFHHFVKHTWKETVNGITETAGKINSRSLRII